MRDKGGRLKMTDLMAMRDTLTVAAYVITVVIIGAYVLSVRRRLSEAERDAQTWRQDSDSRRPVGADPADNGPKKKKSQNLAGFARTITACKNRLYLNFLKSWPRLPTVAKLLRYEDFTGWAKFRGSRGGQEANPIV